MSAQNRTTQLRQAVADQEAKLMAQIAELDALKSQLGMGPKTTLRISTRRTSETARSFDKAFFYQGAQRNLIIASNTKAAEKLAKDNKCQLITPRVSYCFAGQGKSAGKSGINDAAVAMGWPKGWPVLAFLYDDLEA